MKKLLFLAVLGVAGLVNAKSIEEIKPSKYTAKNTEKVKPAKKETKQQYCQTYTMVCWCDSSKDVNDTVCYEYDSPSDRRRAFACMGENSSLYNEYQCGSSSY